MLQVTYCELALLDFYQIKLKIMLDFYITFSLSMLLKK